ncbi:MAG: hypothetical protein AAF974_11815, partial [Cyanobacteria bacterium P01_E01_bin.34]
MTVTKIVDLSTEQRALWPHYRDTWDALSRLVDPIDRSKAGEAAKMAYAMAGYPEPEVVYCTSPKTAQYIVIDALNQSAGILRQSRLGDPIAHKMQSALVNPLEDELSTCLSPHVLSELKLESSDAIVASIVHWLMTPGESYSESIVKMMGVAWNKSIADQFWPLKPFYD